MQGIGRADILLYFKCPTTRQIRCPVNAYLFYGLRVDRQLKRTRTDWVEQAMFKVRILPV